MFVDHIRVKASESVELVVVIEKYDLNIPQNELIPRGSPFPLASTLAQYNKADTARRIDGGRICGIPIFQDILVQPMEKHTVFIKLPAEQLMTRPILQLLIPEFGEIFLDLDQSYYSLRGLRLNMTHWSFDQLFICPPQIEPILAIPLIEECWIGKINCIDLGFCGHVLKESVRVSSTIEEMIIESCVIEVVNLIRLHHRTRILCNCVWIYAK